MEMFCLLTIRQVASRLGVAESTIRAWIWKKKIEHVKIGRSVRISTETIEDLIAENTVSKQLPVEPGRRQGRPNDKRNQL